MSDTLTGQLLGSFTGCLPSGPIVPVKPPGKCGAGNLGTETVREITVNGTLYRITTCTEKP